MMNNLESLFENYIHSAFRFELLPEYSVENELEDFERFKKTGEFIIDQDTREYLDALTSKIKNGAAHIRGRVLDDPLNEYQRFEIMTGYVPSFDLGTQFYFIDRKDFERLNPFSNMTNDFWLFDDKDIAFMKYDDVGHYQGFEIGNNNEVANAIEFKKWFIANSYSMSTLLKKHRLR